MELSFRRANEDDIETIRLLAAKIWHEHYPDIITVEQIDYMLADRYSPQAMQNGMAKGEQYFMAYADDEPVALGCIEPRNDGYFLHKFYVDVARHRGGIGSRFFDYILAQIDSSKPIRLQVNRLNYKAINFYFKNGFVIEAIGDFDIGGGYQMNDFIMLRQP
ncbi:MAG TPA: GNAT family N-acetyltransferase [Chitinophagales bacterium]|nr:GNAT family N-acetyltransferase [Chitinophagales bacterium]